MAGADPQVGDSQFPPSLQLPLCIVIVLLSTGSIELL
jgi:hypothetical protein